MADVDGAGAEASKAEGVAEVTAAVAEALSQGPCTVTLYHAAVGSGDGPPWQLTLRLPGRSAVAADALAAAVALEARWAPLVASFEAAEAAGLRPAEAPITLALWGRRARPETPLHDGDRLELLRPLAMDPKDARRARVPRRVRPGGRASSPAG